MSGYYIFISYKLLKEKNSTKEKKISFKIIWLFNIISFYDFCTFILIDKII